MVAAEREQFVQRRRAMAAVVSLLRGMLQLSVRLMFHSLLQCREVKMGQKARWCCWFAELYTRDVVLHEGNTPIYMLQQCTVRDKVLQARMAPWQLRHC
jgi:hypothetical protein